MKGAWRIITGEVVTARNDRRVLRLDCGHTQVVHENVPVEIVEHCHQLTSVFCLQCEAPELVQAWKIG